MTKYFLIDYHGNVKYCVNSLAKAKQIKETVKGGMSLIIAKELKTKTKWE